MRWLVTAEIEAEEKNEAMGDFVELVPFALVNDCSSVVGDRGAEMTITLERIEEDAA
jgi:hypothetical protein